MNRLLAFIFNFIPDPNSNASIGEQYRQYEDAKVHDLPLLVVILVVTTIAIFLYLHFLRKDTSVAVKRKENEKE